jgi:hypothetical protein
MRHLPRLLITAILVILLGAGAAALTGQLPFAAWFLGISLTTLISALLFSPDGWSTLRALVSDEATPAQEAEDALSWAKALMIVVPAVLGLFALWYMAWQLLGSVAAL